MGSQALPAALPRANTSAVLFFEAPERVGGRIRFPPFMHLSKCGANLCPPTWVEHTGQMTVIGARWVCKDPEPDEDSFDLSVKIQIGRLSIHLQSTIQATTWARFGEFPYIIDFFQGHLIRFQQEMNIKAFLPYDAINEEVEDGILDAAHY